MARTPTLHALYMKSKQCCVKIEPRFVHKIRNLGRMDLHEYIECRQTQEETGLQYVSLIMQAKINAIKEQKGNNFKPN